MAINYSARITDDRGRALRYTLRAATGLVPTGQHTRLIDDAKAAISAEAARWHEDELDTTATVYEKIRYTGHDSDHISLSLTDQNGADGGYLHVYGWTEDED